MPFSSACVLEKIFINYLELFTYSFDFFIGSLEFLCHAFQSLVVSNVIDKLKMLEVVVQLFYLFFECFDDLILSWGLFNYQN
jgi:hypothetical protein